MRARFTILLVATILASWPTLAVAQPAAPRPDSHVILDLVVADWLRNSPDIARGFKPLLPNQAILMDIANVPKGYQPQVQANPVIVSEWHPGQALQAAGTQQYMGRHFVMADDLDKKASDGPDRSIKITSHVLYVEGIDITGNRATVKIATNLHHNQGASGTKYTLRRGSDGWVLLPSLGHWIS